MTDNDLIEKLTQRKAELEAEMNRVAQAAANQAVVPYQAALGEVERMLVMLQPPAPSPAPQP